MLTGRKPDLSKMWIFGSECYAYKHNQKKLEPRCEKGIFWGYSKNSLFYLVYNPQAGNVSKHRLVKFIRKSSAEQQTQTDEDDLVIQNYRDRTQDGENSGDAPQSEESTENLVLDGNSESIDTDNTEVSEHDGIMEKVDTEDNKNSPGSTASASQKHQRSKREPKCIYKIT